MIQQLDIAVSSVEKSVGDINLLHQRKLGTGADLFRFDQPINTAQVAAVIRSIAKDPDVVFVEPNIRLYHTLSPNDEKFSMQYGFQEGIGGSNATLAWDTGYRGANSIVAVLDTGYHPHPDLNANIIDGYDFISDARTANDDNGRDSSALDPGDWVELGFCGPGRPSSKSSWHGTHVAGTVAAVTNNNAGVAGMAYESKVLAVRVLGRCGGTLADIADAITWASGGNIAGVPDIGSLKADVINMSLGGPGNCNPNSIMQDAINGAISRGTTVVVAAGNSNASVSGYIPAGCTGAGLIVVGATDPEGKKALFSNYGADVDVSAPGVDIHSTANTGLSTPHEDGYVSNSGTSMAAPHVAGLVAMMHSKPSIDCAPSECETLVKANSKPFGVVPSQSMGTGIIDALKTINAAP
jgi:serine protease